MKKNRILLIGNSNIANKRYINTFNKNKVQFSVASKSSKKKIKNAYKQYTDYEKAISTSDANIAFISLPNSLHYFWAKRALLNGYHVIVDKPITVKIKDTIELIRLAKQKNKLLSEAVFYNYHRQVKKIKNFLNNNNELVSLKANFTIPMPKKNSLLMSNYYKGGSIMDMGPYASSLHRIFFNKKIVSLKIIIKRNTKKLPIFFEIKVNYRNKYFLGKFKFGGKYKNEIFFFTKKKIFHIDRVFSPPNDLDLFIKEIIDDKIKNIRVPKDNCFENFFLELLKKINEKKFDYYYDQIRQDHLFRDKIKKNSYKLFKEF